jgi:IS30 family transposase
MDRYQHLSVDERRLLLQLLSGGMKVPAVAAQLGRHPSTIYRDIKHNYAYDGHPPFRRYFPVVAHRIAKRRRGKHGNKINWIDGLACYIASRLRAAWSPEQTSGYLPLLWNERLRCQSRDDLSIHLQHRRPIARSALLSPDSANITSLASGIAAMPC